MPSLLGCLVLFLFILGMVVGCGMGVGVLLHWLVPAIDVGGGTLIGVVATGFALLGFGRLMTLPDPAPEEEGEPPPVWRLRPPSRASLATQRPRRRKRS
jgi:hypothetical protein